MLNPSNTPFGNFYELLNLAITKRVSQSVNATKPAPANFKALGVLGFYSLAKLTVVRRPNLNGVSTIFWKFESIFDQLGA